MINFLQLLFVVCLVLLGIGFFFGNFYFLKIFKQVKNQEPAYLDSKINKYSYFDARTQFSIMIFKGRYKDLRNIGLKSKLDKQRWLMMIHFVITIACMVSFIGVIFFKHHIS